MPSPEVQAMIPKIQAYLATQPVERAYLFGAVFLFWITEECIRI